LLLAAALGAGGSGGASAALPVGLLAAGVAAVLLGAAGSGQWPGQGLAAVVASAARHYRHAPVLWLRACRAWLLVLLAASR